MLRTLVALLAISIVLVCSQANSASSRCSALIDNLGKESAPYKFSSPAQELDSLLKERGLRGEDVIDFLSREPDLKKLFDADSGVREGYSIREHSLMVYDIFFEQLPFFIGKLRGPEGVDIVRLLRFIIASHDIGKPIAIENEGKHAQHKYTEPILVEIMTGLGFSKKEIKVSRALINNDIIGDLVKADINANQAHRMLKTRAASASMSIVDYFHLQIFFYTIDAASYPALRRRVFQEINGRLVPKTRRYRELVELIEP